MTKRPTRYGLPYKGSKNKIADWVCDQLPVADNFYDLFCGGCSVTHAQLLRGRFKRYVVNDICGEQDGRISMERIIRTSNATTTWPWSMAMWSR